MALSNSLSRATDINWWCHDFPKLARESGFRFNRHETRVRVDWQRISSIDIDRVIVERDLIAIDENINNIVDCCLENEYDVKILDPNFVKLFRLAQLAIEYLLYCKRYLDHSVVILKDELKTKIKDNNKLNKQTRINEDTVKELKDQLKYHRRGLDIKSSDSHGEIHKCPHCPKTFISGVFMSAHVNRRHASCSHVSSQLRPSSPILDERYRAETEKLHNEIKSLKERLNVTERLTRKDSDKLLSSDSIGVIVSTRDQDESKNPQQAQYSRRYEDEIKDFKETLLSEIRQQNLKLVDRFNMAKEEDSRNISGNAKELIRQQENEIQRLRQQLDKRVTPDIEDIQGKLNNQEDLWRTKIENLESRHALDMEKLYRELTITRESSDRMRLDYITKINDIERQSQDRLSKSIPIINKTIDETIPPSPSRVCVTPSKNNSTSSKRDHAKELCGTMERNLGENMSLTSTWKETHEPLINRIDKKHSNSLKNIENSEENAIETFVPLSSLASEKTTRKIDQKATVHYSVKNTPNTRDKSVTKNMDSYDSASETEMSSDNITSYSSSSSGESGLESDSQIDNSDDNLNEKDSEINITKDHTIDQLNLKLRDLGVDPEWQGIPKATLKQIMERVRHHRNLNCKKYRKLEDIRRELSDQVTRKICTEGKKNVNSSEKKLSNESPLREKGFLRTTKSLTILDKRRGSQNSESMTRRDSNEKPMRGIVKLKSSREQINRDRSRIVGNNSEATAVSAVLSDKNSINFTGDVKKYLSRSYESLKSFHQYEGANNSRQPNSISVKNNDISGVLVTSTPRKNGQQKQQQQQQQQEEEVEQDEFLSTKSTRNGLINKSVMKVTSRDNTAGNVVKKKVVFHLDNSADNSPVDDKDNDAISVRDCSENDCEVTSINGDTDNRQEENTRVMVFKSRQSEKIARISKEIELQLNVARQKPVGSIEAMFADQLVVTKDDKEIKTLPSSNQALHPQAAPRTSKNSEKSSLNLNYSSNDSNLDHDIDQLLEIE